MINCKCGLTGGCELCRPIMDIGWGEWYGGEPALPTKREQDIAYKVAIAEVCPRTLVPSTYYETKRIELLQLIILRAFREAKL